MELTRRSSLTLYYRPHLRERSKVEPGAFVAHLRQLLRHQNSWQLRAKSRGDEVGRKIPRAKRFIDPAKMLPEIEQDDGESLTRHKSNYCNKPRTCVGTELAICNTLCVLCTRIWARVRFDTSTAMSASRITDSEAVTFSNAID